MGLQDLIFHEPFSQDVTAGIKGHCCTSCRRRPDERLLIRFEHQTHSIVNLPSPSRDESRAKQVDKWAAVWCLSLLLRGTFCELPSRPVMCRNLCGAPHSLRANVVRGLLAEQL